MGSTKIGRTKISHKKLVDTKISREERVVESIMIFENPNINNLRVKVRVHPHLRFIKIHSSFIFYSQNNEILLEHQHYQYKLMHRIRFMIQRSFC